MKSYFERQNESGFEIGDRVKLIRRVESYTEGWNNTWISPDMDKKIGQEGNIYEVGDNGLKINWGEAIICFYYPYFALEKICNNPKVKDNKWNSKCPKCGSDAYQGLHLIECSRGCNG